MSHDGSRLYVLATRANAGEPISGKGNPILFPKTCKKGTSGILAILDVTKAEGDSDPVLARVAAGCSPVRMTESSDGATLWVSAREDDRILAFDSKLLELDPDGALIGHLPSGGAAPVGIQLFARDRLLAVANSNRYDPNDAGNLAILDVTEPSAMALIKTLPAGAFAREVSVGADDATLYLTNANSRTFQVVTTVVR